MSMLRKIILGLATIAFLGLATTPAFATPVWEGCTSLEEGGNFENEGCTKEKAEGGFEFLELQEPVTITGTGSLEFEDSKASTGTLRVKCTAETSGKDGSGSKGKIETMPLTGCSVVKGTCESPKVSAVGLPWSTELGETKDSITTSGSGFTITCGTGSKVVEDKCEFEKESTEEEDLSSEGDVNMKFNGSSGKAICNHGEKCPMRSATGTVEGTLKIKAEHIGLAVLTPWVSRANVGGVPIRGEPICNFTAVLQTCQIQFSNATMRSLKVLNVRIEGVEAGVRYKKAVVGCVFNMALSPSCTDEVEMTKLAVGTINDYCIEVRDQGTLEDRTMCALLKM